MKQFRVEHYGVAVANPIEMAEWYKKVLGFEIALSGGDNEKSVAFIRPSGESTMIELFNLPEVSELSGTITHHLQFHIAFSSDDPDIDTDYLIENGASFIEKCPNKMTGDYLVVVRDPWGNTIQLVKRNGKRFNSSMV